jgi:hypothetical protein
MTEFEKRLREIPLRRPSPTWRSEILCVAEARGTPTRPALSAVFQSLRNLLWPHPAAWAVLAAGWLFTAVLSFSGPGGYSLWAVTPPGKEGLMVTPERFAAHANARDRLLAAPSDETPIEIERTRL